MKTSQMFLSSSITGAAVWLTAAVILHPAPTNVTWANLLLLFGSLVVVPLGLRLVAQDEPSYLLRISCWLQLPAALCLGFSFLGTTGVVTGLLSLPWFAVTCVIAVAGVMRIANDGLVNFDRLAVNAGLVYLAVGGGWAALSRIGIRPLDFAPVIVLLTAIHFHYAGFALPLITGTSARRIPGLGAQFTCLGVIVSVPAVAVGITATQLGLSPLIECLAAELMSFSGLLAAGLQLRIAVKGGMPRWARALLLLSAVSLAFGMALSALYGARAILSVEAIDIPWMRALHGTANALGFALCGLIAWNWRVWSGAERLH